MKQKILAVVDTNILIGALLTGSKDKSPMYKIVERFKQNHFLLIYDHDLLTEYEDKLIVNPIHSVQRGEAIKLLDDIKESGLICRKMVPAALPDVPNDPKDRHLLSSLLSGNADVIISCDKKTREYFLNLFDGYRQSAESPEDFIVRLNAWSLS